MGTCAEGGRGGILKKEIYSALVTWTLEDSKNKFSDTVSLLKA